MTQAPTDPGRGGQVMVASDAGLGWITLDNPGKLNAMSLSMWAALIDALARLDADDRVRCVIVRGAGDRAFCVGADIDEKQGVKDDQASADLDVGLSGLDAVVAFKKPLLAMISGYCIGAGMSIASACDLRLASDQSSFGVPPAKLGLGYPYAETKRLVDLVGPSVARHMLFTAERLSAERALTSGLVNEVVPSEALLERTTQVAARIASNAPLSIAVAKRAVAVATSDPLGREIGECNRLARACLVSEDYLEGRRAFAEKRAPAFRGR